MSQDQIMGHLGIASTAAKINVRAAGEVLRKYALRNVRFLLDAGEGSVEVAVDEDAVTHPYYPYAVPAAEAPRRDDYGDDEAYEDAVTEVYCDRGADGFTSLLRELSVCLTTTLTVLAVRAADDALDCDSVVWRVEPGTGTVEVLSAGANH